MTQFRIYANQPGVGRKKQFPVRIVLPLPEGTVERIDAILADGEARPDVIREAIERELKRLERERGKPSD